MMGSTKILFGIAIVMFIYAISILFVGYNFETHLWYDKPYLNPDYYVFHPHEEDTCDDLESKFGLFHPKGSNPIRFEILQDMFEKECKVKITI